MKWYGDVDGEMFMKKFLAISAGIILGAYFYPLSRLYVGAGGSYGVLSLTVNGEKL